MATDSLKTFAKNAGTTPQTERSRADEVKNNAGGFVFKVSDKDRLERFLILGTNGGTYYVGEKKLTADSVAFVNALIAKDEKLVRETVLDVRRNNRAAKQTPTIFVLASLMQWGKDKVATRAAVSEVISTSTQLFDFAQFLKDLGGLGRAKRSALAGWYESKTPESLAYQAVKYRQRNGWTHRDLFRLSHPKGVDTKLGNFILGKDSSAEIAVVQGFQAVQSAGTVKEVVSVLQAYPNLPWEAIPTQYLTDAEVWKTLFYNGALGQTALLRNVTRFAKNGALDDLTFAGDVAKALADEQKIVKGRVHPVAYANALGIYQNGPHRSEFNYGYNRGYNRPEGKTWGTNAKVLAALEAGFYSAFATVEPAGKATMISIDTSGSMTWGAPAGLVGMNYAQAAACMAMVTLRTEPYVEINAFSTTLKPVNVSAADSLESVTNKINRALGGGTDCSLPMRVAREKGRKDLETFMVFTDNETWAGREKPYQSLVKYRKSSGVDARLAVVAFAGTEFTIADPTDRGMMDFVGFDSSAPSVMANFSAGRI